VYMLGTRHEMKHRRLFPKHVQQPSNASKPRTSILSMPQHCVVAKRILQGFAQGRQHVWVLVRVYADGRLVRETVTAHVSLYSVPSVVLAAFWSIRKTCWRSLLGDLSSIHYSRSPRLSGGPEVPRVAPKLILVVT
jgi:hypothetical protein